MAEFSRDRCEAMDAADELAPFRDRFAIPSGIIYMLGNSLGPPPRAAVQWIDNVVRGEWGDSLARGWTDAGWWNLPLTLGARISRLIGAAPDEVVVTDSTTIDVFKLVVAAIRLRPGRRVVVTEAGNFPTDLYAIEEAASMAGGLEVRRAADVDAVVAAIDDETAVVELTHVDYRTARIAPMAEITHVAHEHGALVVWDLCHSVGAVEVELNASAVDFAVGCTYKYLNGGPGAPAFVFAASRHHGAVRQPLAGWIGHARPFDFEPDYEPAPGVRRFCSGSPPILSLAALDASLSVWDSVDPEKLFAKRRALSQLLIELLEPCFAAGGLELASPRDSSARGSHVALRHPQAQAFVGALELRRVLADFRRPDLIRLGIAPLYLRFVDVWEAAGAIVAVAAESELTQAQEGSPSR